MAVQVGTTNSNNMTMMSNSTNRVILAKDLPDAVTNVRDTDRNELVQMVAPLKEEMIKSGEMDKLTAKINITKPQTINDFGKEPAMELSKCADEVLRKYDSNSLVETTKLMTAVAKIMDQIDVREIEGDSAFSKLFKKMGANKLDKIMKKYNGIGANLEKICIELTKHDDVIKSSSTDIENLHTAYTKLYKSLERYIIAGEQAEIEVDAYIQKLESESNPDKLTIASVKQSSLLLKQRVQELRAVETLALQSIPVLKSYQFNNLNLSRKINSAFIITIPAFKGAISQAVLAKQQRITADGLAAFDEKTNEMLIRNSEIARDNMVGITQLTTQQTFKTETLQQCWANIMDGVNQVNDIINNMESNIDVDKATLELMNKEYIQKLGGNVV